MMRVTRKTGLIALLALSTVAMAACGNSGDSASSSPNATGTTKGKTTVTFWSWVPIDVQAKALIADFEQKNPDIKVDYWRGELPDYQKKLQVAIAAGEGPDLMGMQVGGMLNQYAPYLEPVKPLADKNWGAGWEDKLIPASTKQTVVKNGTIAALPMYFSAQEFIIYNKTIFDKLGIKEVPKTYDELKKVSETIRQNGNGVLPLAYGGKDVWHDTDMFVALSNQFAPGKVYEAEQGKASWSDPAFVDTMKAWKKMFDDKVIQEGALGLATYPDARDQYFYSGKAAMFPTGSWHVGYALPGGEKAGTKIENDETGFFLLPQVGPNPSRAVASVDTAVAINKDSKQKEAAWKLFSYLTMDNGQQILADFLQGTPSKKGVEAKAEALNQFKFESEKQAVKVVNEATANSVGKRLLDYPELTTAIGIAMQDVAAGKAIEDALKSIQKVSDGIKR